VKRNPPKSPKGRGPRGSPPVFGRSLHVDLYGVSRERCEDINFCYRLLDGLVRHLGMHKQAPPYLFRSPEAQFPDKAGLSGWVPLIESGISLHTLTLRGFVTVDIYTCGQLDVEASVRFLSCALETTDLEQHYLDRGSRYHA
jgi:S-adenosylmethionine/arginine decarboxylase-like enzyme